MIGQAVPSVMPSVASRYFNKTECFCFVNQSFGAGERREMPVSFVIDPSLPRDVETVTLSYTFFDVTQTAAKSIGN
jgi:cytochrome c oxidase assembly protein subunit 11